MDSESRPSDRGFFSSAGSSNGNSNSATRNTKSAAVHRTGDVWYMEAGPVRFKLEAGPTEVMKSEVPKHLVGQDCWSEGCGKGGPCEWCGAGNGCCRLDFDDDPPECRKVDKKFHTVQYHECVPLGMELYKHPSMSLLWEDHVLLKHPMRKEEPNSAATSQADYWAQKKANLIASKMSDGGQGLWAIGSKMDLHGWPTKWDYGVMSKIEILGPWLVIFGHVDTPEGTWIVRDQLRLMESDGVVEGLRRWTWTGSSPSPPSVLAVAWTTPGQSEALLMPGVLYHGNPAGKKNRARGWRGLVPAWNGKVGDLVQVEEHRLPQPWASLEYEQDGVRWMTALHSQPSAPAYGEHPDLSWSLGAEGTNAGTVLHLLSGPVALNGKAGVVKVGQSEAERFNRTGLAVPPGKKIEKRYWLQADKPQEGAGFRAALSWALLHADLSSDSLPTFAEIVEAKVRFAMTRWNDHKHHKPGFAMFPDNKWKYVMGWAGQSDAPGYALQVLADRLERPELLKIAWRTLDTLSMSAFNAKGFHVQFDASDNTWKEQDPVSQGQAMSSFARAIRAGRARGADTRNWEKFLRRACLAHATRILSDQWQPRSTAEAFLIQPLCLASKLLNDAKDDGTGSTGKFLAAAVKAGSFYSKRHLGTKEPYWGGTLDASCEDKEGAWAGFEAFLALYEATEDPQWLAAANHAADMTLTYTYLWNVDLPPGRLRDHRLLTRGWTSVSVQNMHLDVYGVLYSPRLWRLGQLAGRPELLRLAELMYRTCGQMIDAWGSQGEQLQQTRFAQAGDLSDPDRYRGGYVESWTVFWITAHFLTAAALFEELGVLKDLWRRH